MSGIPVILHVPDEQPFIKTTFPEVNGNHVHGSYAKDGQLGAVFFFFCCYFVSSSGIVFDDEKVSIRYPDFRQNNFFFHPQLNKPNQYQE